MHVHFDKILITILFSALKSLKNSEDKELKSAINGALWQLEGKEKHVADVANSHNKKGKKIVNLFIVFTRK